MCTLMIHNVFSTWEQGWRDRSCFEDKKVNRTLMTRATGPSCDGPIGLCWTGPCRLMILLVEPDSIRLLLSGLDLFVLNRTLVAHGPCRGVETVASIVVRVDVRVRVSGGSGGLKNTRIMQRRCNGLSWFGPIRSLHPAADVLKKHPKSRVTTECKERFGRELTRC
jgi:hypothetical protein